MSRRRPLFKQKTPIFLGCEGESEQGYGQVLNELLADAGIPVHLEVRNLNPGAGDPIARLRRAEIEIRKLSQARLPYSHKFVLMDSDQLGQNKQLRQSALQLAAKLGIQVIWQEPCHEALLLRHLPGLAHHRPLTTSLAAKALQANWPQYAKPMTKMLLKARIGLAEIKQAASVEPSLRDLLTTAGLYP